MLAHRGYPANQGPQSACAENHLKPVRASAPPAACQNYTRMIQLTEPAHLIDGTFLPDKDSCEQSFFEHIVDLFALVAIIVIKPLGKLLQDLRVLMYMMIIVKAYRRLQYAVDIQKNYALPDFSRKNRSTAVL